MLLKFTMLPCPASVMGLRKACVGMRVPVASCGIEQCIYAPIEAYHLIAHLVDSLDVGHIAHHESGVPTLLADVFSQLFAYVLSASQQNNLGTFVCQM